jgi:Protein of unknown function (DUF3551)
MSRAMGDLLAAPSSAFVPTMTARRELNAAPMLFKAGQRPVLREVLRVIENSRNVTVEALLTKQIIQQRRQMMKSGSRIVAAAGLMFTAALLATSPKPAVAANASENYCLNPASGGSSCGFTSMEQCQETMRGRNGWCSKAVDFGAAANSGPANSFASYPRGSKMSPADKELSELHKNSMPVKGVGAE